MKNIVIIGGGTGTFTLLSGLRQFPVNNSVIVSTADDGGSTGRLRDELGVVPPGDIRQCLVGLSYTEQSLKDLFSYRFAQGSLSGHTVGNIIIVALEKILGNTESAIKITAKLLNVRGQVVPVTTYPTILSAVLQNGRIITGEHNIDEPAGNVSLHIKSLHLSPQKPPNPRALDLIRRADAIIFGPGDLYTSTIPNLLVKGVKETIQKSKSTKILVTNIMTKFGQTNNFQASDFVRVLEEYLDHKLDVVVANNQSIDSQVLKQYHRVKAKPVKVDIKALQQQGIKVIARPLVSKIKQAKIKGDVIKRSLLRHDSAKLAKIIWKLVQ